MVRSLVSKLIVLGLLIVEWRQQDGLLTPTVAKAADTGVGGKSDANAPTRFGMFIDCGAFPTQPDISQRPFRNEGKYHLTPAGNAALTLDLGVTIARPFFTTEIVPANHRGSLEFKKAGITLVATVVNHPNNRSPSPPITTAQQMRDYERFVDAVLLSGSIEVLVVENEECSPQFYTGAPEDYAAQLKVAVSLAKARGILVTNGGLTNHASALVTWRHVLATKGKVAADAFVRDAFSPVSFSNETDESSRRFHEALLSESDAVQLPALKNFFPKMYGRLMIATRFVEIYKESSMDFVNVHFYQRSEGTLSEIIDYMGLATGKRVMTNEIGYYDGNPATVLSMLQTTYKKNLAYVLWSNGDCQRSFALQNIRRDGSWVLRDSGIVFRDFVKDKNVRPDRR